jgi:RNA polymerase sigma factor (sigma-70 family)
MMQAHGPRVNRAGVELFRRTEHQRPVGTDPRHAYEDASDAALLRASSNGDDRAFASLYERHARKIYNYLFRRLADWSEAEDLTAVVFLEAFRRRADAVLVEGELSPWLYGVATNVLRNRRRAQWRHRHLLAQLAREPRAPAAPDLHDRIEASEQMRSVLERIRTLPRSQQDVVALCVWSGLSYEEAAAALRVPLGTVRSRLARARASLTELESSPRHSRLNVEQKGMVEQ